MEKKAKAEAKRQRRLKRKQGPESPEGVEGEEGAERVETADEQESGFVTIEMEEFDDQDDDSGNFSVDSGRLPH
jgi:hypothetical protein